jgi:hypothetical protein
LYEYVRFRQWNWWFLFVLAISLSFGIGVPNYNIALWDIAITKQSFTNSPETKLALREGNACTCTSVLIYTRSVFLNHRALASIIPGPRLIEKRIYWAAVWQRLRITALGGLPLKQMGTWLYSLWSLSPYFTSQLSLLRAILILSSRLHDDLLCSLFLFEFPWHHFFYLAVPLGALFGRPFRSPRLTPPPPNNTKIWKFQNLFWDTWYNSLDRDRHIGGHTARHKIKEENRGLNLFPEPTTSLLLFI